MSRRSVLMEALEATPRDLARTLRRVDEAQSLHIASPEHVSIAGMMRLLLEHELRTLARWRRIILPAPSTVTPETDSETKAAETLPELLSAFTAQRTATLAFLRGLHQREWGIVVEHGVTNVRLRDDVQALVAHDNQQLNVILELRDG